MPLSWVRALFSVIGLYDFALGLAFVGWSPWIFDAAGIPAPDHWGYIQFAALLVMIFGLAFFAIAYDPSSNRNLIPYGLLLKLSYVGIVVYYWLTGAVPTLFLVFAFMDAAMLVAILVAYGTVASRR